MSLEYFVGDELCHSVFQDKYSLRDADDKPSEATPDEMHKRMAREIARIEKGKFKEPYSEEFIYDLFKGFGYIIPQGGPMYGIGNPQYVTLSNCFVVEPPLDSYGSIHATDEFITQISKRRGGVGTDVSHIRPANTPTSNAARKATGVVLFCERFSCSIREVGQNGRRGAQLLSISVHHPEVLEFARMKLDPKKVTGANVSIRLTDEFLNAVEKGETYQQRWPVDGEPKISRMVDAKEVWKEIIKCAWKMAEPGLLFWDQIIRESPADCYADLGFKTVSTNPCCFSVTEPVMVRTKAGLKEIKTITCEDEIWSDPFFWRKTDGYFSAGLADVYRITFSNKASLLVTWNHKFLVKNEYDWGARPLSEIKLGDVVATAEDGEGVTEVVSIEHDSVQETGCIEVKVTGWMVANGIVSGNSELPLCANDSCRLLVLNLFAFVDEPFTKRASFNFKKFYEYAQIAQRLMDDIVDLELECIGRIIRKVMSDPEPPEIKHRELTLWENIRKTCYKARRTGTGITALGDAIAGIGLKYGSDASIAFTERIYRTLKFGAYRSSVNIAKELDPFPIWDKQREEACPFFLRFRNETCDLGDDETVLGKQLYADMQKHGRANIALLTTAPAGTVSLLAGPAPYFGSTSGIEPLFTDTPYTRRKKITPGMDNPRVDFVDEMGDKWTNFQIFHSKIKQWMEVTGETDWKKSPYHGATANDIDWKQRVKLQAAATRHLDHSSSSTLNLPKDVTEEKVAEIYETAWRSGCKGITVYRDSCRDGVLFVDDKRERITKTTAAKRPKDLPCDIHHVSVQKVPFVAVVGLVGGDPYEIFAFPDKVPLSKKHGLVRKVKRGVYELRSLEGENLLEAPEGITSLLNGQEEALTRMVSTALRHGADIGFVAHQLEKTKDELTSFAKALARALKRYIKDGTIISGEKCEKCGQEAMERAEGCALCKACGASKCA